MKQINNWHSIPVDPQDFNLFSTLNSGQAFRWVFNSTLNEWHGVINGHLWRLRQMEDSNPVEYYLEKNSKIKLNDVPFDLRDYFRLDMNLSDLVKEWSIKDKWFENRFSKNCQMDTARGLRLLRQDPEETLFSFITSANNNLTRITKLLCKLLAANWLLKNGGRSRLLELRSVSHVEAQAFLLQIPGIGKKVADCICLMSLDKLDVVPIDVHMLRVAREKGIPEASCKTMTTKSYDIISKSLSDFWGNYSGWAQTILFYTRIMESKPNKKLKEQISRFRVNS
ncbi:putative 8-oxoguanine DNA glycosylase [Schistosoma mansoni]|uniref:putative 8-oxoguanine DNA glycosylase n=1 Tax=Schistosoma mansoni TaxID=6183 RepID=UPI00022DC806|nr:putative 8-oxoguanine DNA glycosylase [Schistosoma mansoni]|eukprot:XP_018650737.1 putative 8-oxoguanine DNA glycosylase [Schistosoma mansoni]